jgi:hypothetical protein
MTSLTPERRHRERRGCLRGGRRATDVASAELTLPACPSCGRLDVAQEAGTAEGGWWFVCRDCDHLWDERERHRAFVERCAKQSDEGMRTADGEGTTTSRVDVPLNGMV